MSNWQSLMALSRVQTEEEAKKVELAIADRKRREAQKLEEIARKEKRDRELEAKLRLKRLEEQKREEERRARHERERRAKEEELQRRADQERDALRYGPKKARDSQGYPLSSASRHRQSLSDDDDSSGPSSALTREEKRQRRLQAELRGGRSTTRRTTGGGGGYGKAGKRLPGGAVDIPSTLVASSSSSPGKSVRDRIAAEPNGLFQLNKNKRDTRTIDEILRDRAKAREGKVLDGEAARDFDDWFGKSKKEPPKKPSVPATSTPNSRAHTPGINGFSASSQSKAASASASPSPFSAVPPKSQSASKSHTPPAKGTSVSKAGAMKAPLPKAKSTTSSTSASRLSASSSKAILSASASKPISRKRRSPSSSMSPPPPAKRRPAVANDISSEIWKLFGKDRRTYVERDDYSDDDDMEAGALDVEWEEKRSARLARKEDAQAEADLKRHEAEKLRRKKEKEKRGNY